MGSGGNGASRGSAQGIVAEQRRKKAEDDLQAARDLVENDAKEEQAFLDQEVLKAQNAETLLAQKQKRRASGGRAASFALGARTAPSNAYNRKTLLGS
jgi:hypothetical protein